jgi:ParB family chromosome partitioning protein
MTPNTTTEYRDLPLAVLTESTTNPRRIYDNSALKELAESIRVQGVLSPRTDGRGRNRSRAHRQSY